MNIERDFNVIAVLGGVEALKIDRVVPALSLRDGLFRSDRWDLVRGRGAVLRQQSRRSGIGAQRHGDLHLLHRGLHAGVDTASRTDRQQEREPRRSGLIALNSWDILNAVFRFVDDVFQIEEEVPESLRVLEREKERKRRTLLARHLCQIDLGRGERDIRQQFGVKSTSPAGSRPR